MTATDRANDGSTQGNVLAVSPKRQLQKSSAKTIAFNWGKTGTTCQSSSSFLSEVQAWRCAANIWTAREVGN